MLNEKSTLQDLKNLADKSYSITMINKYPSEIIEESKYAVLSRRLDTDGTFYEIHTKSQKKGRDKATLEFYKTTSNLEKAILHYYAVSR